jgi:hypothetical protein
VARAAVGGNIWHTASHAEHARPMLHATGAAMQQALLAAFDSAQELASAEAVLGYVVTLVNLAGGVMAGAAPGRRCCRCLAGAHVRSCRLLCTALHCTALHCTTLQEDICKAL